MLAVFFFSFIKGQLGIYIDLTFIEKEQTMFLIDPWQYKARVLLNMYEPNDRTEDTIWDLYVQHPGLVPSSDLVGGYVALRRILLPHVAK